MGLLILPNGVSSEQDIAKAMNTVVKQFRGKSRPFITLIVEDNGAVSVVSNMDVYSQRVSLLKGTADALRGN